MKIKKLFMLLMLGVASIGGASAHGGRVGVGIQVGPYWGPPAPFFYPAPYPYYPYRSQVIVVPAAPPPVYIEQAQEAVPTPSVPPDASGTAQQYWYYCAGASGYYPYVKECPGGWQKVLPQPAR